MATNQPHHSAPSLSASGPPRPSAPQVEKPGCDHFVQFYEDDAYLVRSVVDFVGAAIGAGSAGVVIATAEHRAAIETGLTEHGFDLPTVKERNRLAIVDAAETLAAFMRDGMPDPGLFEVVVGGLLARISVEGRKPHAFGEMVALLFAEGNGEGAIRLESLWNDLSRRLEFTLLCAYPIAAFSDAASAEMFERVCGEHQRVIPTEDYAAEVLSERDRDRSVAILQQKAYALESEIAERRRAEAALREQTRTLDILQRVANSLVAERELASVVQIVTDAGCELSGAAFGAFFYNQKNSEGEFYTLYTLSGAPAEAFSNFPMPHATEIFRPTFEGRGVLRLGDVTADPRFGKSGPYFGLPPGHLPVRSYLAVPVVSNAGTVLGGLFFGNPAPNIFTEVTEQVVVALAAQAAIAIENSNLNATLQRELDALTLAEEKSRQLAAIVESSEDAIISKRLDGTILTWNAGAQRIFGYEPHEIIGRHVTTLFPPDHLDEEPAIIAKIRRGERVDHYETRRMRKDGELLDISLTVSPVRNDRGEIVGASKIARDITQRKRAEAALARATAELARSRDELERRVEERTASLREAIAQMEEFSYTVSHDLRAPLRAMNVYSRTLAEDFGELLAAQPEAVACVQKIAENSARLDKMIRDVLAYGRVARDELALESVSLDTLVRETIYHYQVLQPPLAHVHVEPLGDVIGHEPSVMQVLSNLLTNAVKFVAPGVTPEVRVWTERQDGWVRLNVQDNGIGIEPEYHHRLFGMFERIHPKLPYEGTGVGLAIVRKATERMGGRVGVESDGRTGSLFWVELPEPK